MVVNLAGVTHRGALTSTRLRNHIEVADKLKGTFIVLLALVNIVLEVADELVMRTWRNIGLENVENIE